MKLIIDIPDWKYKSICEGIEASKRCGVIGTDPDIHEAIYKGKPYEERPQGEWKLNTQRLYYAKRQYYCSNCNSEIHYSDLGHDYPIFSNFCPNCGADMRKGGAKC